MKLRALLLAGLCVVGGQARAGLFNDDEAREQIRQLASKVEETSKQQADTNKQQAEINKQQVETNKQQTETNKQQTETNKQQTRTMLDLQSQIEGLNTELRSLRGQNEELTHNLQDADKRQKDFYIDLDTRVRHFETVEAAANPQPIAGSSVPATDDLAAGDRAYEMAHSLFKTGKHQGATGAFQEFLKKFPESVYASDAYYEMGLAYFVLNDCKNALVSYQALVDKYSLSPKVPEAMLGIADCQQELKDVAAVKKTLKQLLAKYPGSEAASEAKKRLATLK